MVRLLVLAAMIAACGDNRAGAADPEDAEPGKCVPRRGRNVVMRQVAVLDAAPLLLTAPAGDPRQFVVENRGKIRIIERGEVRAQPFLDLSLDAGGPVACCNERGLLGLAFHPSYASNGTFFVFYTTLTKNVLARYQRRDDYTADPASGVELLAIDDMFANHNGGMIEFGSDGFLYIGTGDGGGSGDPNNAGQNPRDLLGKMLRIDVDNKLPGKQYAIPAGNPFADGVAGEPEIFMLGLRNPWRWSFDRANGDIWIGDVGQDLIEELDYTPAGQLAGVNYGWSTFEGASCFKPPCSPAGHQGPVVSRTHAGDGWCSIIGGQVYRGSCYPDLVGTYFFTDFCRHTLEAARARNGSVELLPPPSVSYIDIGAPERPGFPVTPSSLHEDGRGELYLTTVSCCGSSFVGGVYRLEAAP